jgi:predicted TIM-barrel fold metal-dependent hydrolase
VVDAHVHLGQSIYGERLDLDTLLARMDKHEIDMSVVAGFTPPDLDFSRVNSEIAQAVRSHPDRLVGAIRVDPRLGDASRNEILRAAESYGFRILALHPAEQGFQVNHPLVLPHIELAEQQGLLVHVPTGYPLFSTPMQVAALARHFPSVPFLMGHMGLNAYLFDALEAMVLYPNLCVETAGHLVTGEIMNGVRMAIEAGGAERVVFASGEPYFDVAIELLKIQTAHLPPETEALVLGGNCQRLLSREANG